MIKEFNIYDNKFDTKLVVVKTDEEDTYLGCKATKIYELKFKSYSQLENFILDALYKDKNPYLLFNVYERDFVKTYKNVYTRDTIKWWIDMSLNRTDKEAKENDEEKLNFYNSLNYKGD